MFRICYSQHRSMATCQQSSAQKNSFMIAAGLLTHYAFLPRPRLIPNVRFFLHSLPLLVQRQSTLPPPGQLEYYNTAWGLKKVHLKGDISAVSRLSRRYLEVRNLKDSVSDIQWCHNCVPWPHTSHVRELPTKCHISTFIV